jgi:hypothetical protein
MCGSHLPIGGAGLAFQVPRGPSQPKIRRMGKADARDKIGQAGPVRTSSGTRVAMRITTLEPDPAWQRGANDMHDMPTRELDLDEVRAMALRCASDIGPAQRAHPSAPVLPAAEPSRPRLQLVLHEDEAPSSAVDADLPEGLAGRSRRSWALALVIVVVALATATAAAFEVYGVLP